MVRPRGAPASGDWGRLVFRPESKISGLLRTESSVALALSWALMSMVTRDGT